VLKWSSQAKVCGFNFWRANSGKRGKEKGRLEASHKSPLDKADVMLVVSVGGAFLFGSA